MLILVAIVFMIEMLVLRAPIFLGLEVHPVAVPKSLRGNGRGRGHRWAYKAALQWVWELPGKQTSGTSLGQL